MYSDVFSHAKVVGTVYLRVQEPPHGKNLEPNNKADICLAVFEFTPALDGFVSCSLCWSS
jgi:hypothetical protein